MRLKDFNYDLPQGLIAQHPTQRRDDARLMVIDRARKTITHDIFRNIGKHLPANSLIVVNNSKVVPARLLGKRQKTGGQVEIFLLKKMDSNRYEALLKPLKKIKVEEPLEFPGSVIGYLEDKENRIVRFNKRNLEKYLTRIGHIPLPPYINRDDTARDRREYQTVYAKYAGSVASPTAGLHFTNSLLTKIKKAGHAVVPLTLHINYGTFKPVECEDIVSHPMHSEDYSISASGFARVRKARDGGRKIVAVGTTSCRVLESVSKSGHLSGSTNIFIYPGISFTMTDCLITNFHLPASTLLMLVYAFGGMDFMKKAYAEAIRQKYRFYSYGDATLIL
jgi:S-adenosylmethionine:tRNA ribosyltransferase-isomerase